MVSSRGLGSSWSDGPVVDLGALQGPRGDGLGPVDVRLEVGLIPATGECEGVR